MKEKIIQYEPTGKKVSLEDLVDTSKVALLINSIHCSNVSDDEKDFLLKAAQRHLIFNYSNIAEYYSTASKEMQELMEESGLVIIDVNDAIQNGFVKLCDEIHKESANE